MKRVIKVGTRKSLLALKQTEMAVDALKSRFPEFEFEKVGISTRGDRNLEKPLGEIGDKGLFVSEIERLIKIGEIDFAVHSGKDLPLELYEGLEISGVLSRDDRRDVLVTKKGRGFENLKTIGTGSKRRALQCSKLVENCDFKLIRGNINTRLEKLCRGEYDGIILAAAGLDRLKLYKDSRFDFRPFTEEEMIPAACQGIIVIEALKNSDVSELIKAVQCEKTRKEFDCERYILKLLGGDCSASIGASAKFNEGIISCSVMYGDKRSYFETDEKSFKTTAEKYIRDMI